MSTRSGCLCRFVKGFVVLWSVWTMQQCLGTGVKASSAHTHRAFKRNLRWRIAWSSPWRRGSGYKTESLTLTIVMGNWSVSRSLYVRQLYVIFRKRVVAFQPLQKTKYCVPARLSILFEWQFKIATLNVPLYSVNNWMVPILLIFKFSIKQNVL